MTAIQEIHKAQIAMLNTFMQICEKLSLKWWVTTDTLIGAVLKQGFLDNCLYVTLAMPREDYEKFIIQTLPPPYIIQTEDNTPGLCFHGALVRNCATTYLQLNEQYNPIKYNRGIFLKIIPMDFCEPMPKHIVEGYRQAINLNAELTQRNMQGNLTTQMFDGMVQAIHQQVMAFVNFGRTRKPNDTIIDYGLFVHSAQDVPPVGLNAEIARSMVKMKFESLAVNAPVMYRDVLETTCGEKWQLNAQRCNHHNRLFLADVHTPYTVTLQNLNNTLSYYAR